MSIEYRYIDYWPVSPSAASAPPYEHPDRDTPHCQTLYARATACYDDHHAKYAEHVIGSAAYLAIKDRIQREQSVCFRLAKQHARECGGGISISPPRRR